MNDVEECSDTEVIREGVNSLTVLLNGELTTMLFNIKNSKNVTF